MSVALVLNLYYVSSVSISAKDNDRDVVLVDTAGRMQDNEPLMRSLAKVNVFFGIAGGVG